MKRSSPVVMKVVLSVQAAVMKAMTQNAPKPKLEKHHTDLRGRMYGCNRLSQKARRKRAKWVS